MTNEPKSQRSGEQGGPSDRNPPNFNSKQLQEHLEKIFREVDKTPVSLITDDPGTDSEYLWTSSFDKESSLSLYAGNYLSGTLPQLIIETPNGPVVFLLSYSRELTEIELQNRHLPNRPDQLLEPT